MNLTRIAATAIALGAALNLCHTPAFAGDGCSNGGCLTKMCSKMFGCKNKTTVYLCPSQKLYFSQDVAKQMNYLDPMGNPLVKAKTAPSDYQNGAKAATENHRN